MRWPKFYQSLRAVWVNHVALIIIESALTPAVIEGDTKRRNQRERIWVSVNSTKKRY